MASEALFDTTVFVDWHQGDEAALQLLADVIHGHLKAAFSPVTVVELWQGEMKSREEEAGYGSLLGRMEEIALTASAAREAGRRIRGLPRDQRLLFLADVMIAATAESRGQVLYSRDAHMPRFYPNVRSY